ncbi:MAG TPA: DUF2959 family protein [Planctomycetota bacterium]|nr:DUF2959 family protein [Planctomycetota bacterium]
MRHRHPLFALTWLFPVTLALFSCSSTQSSEGLTRVDVLLTHVERIQIESLVAREKAAAAFDAFGQIVAPDFSGDPMLAYNDLVMKVKASKEQAEKLQYSVDPMNDTADSVFRSWTTDLEKFGNTNLRQASQARLAETRSRYSAVHDAAIAALVSINAFNSDLNDQALFLEHDFNSASVSVIATEVPALTSQARDLSKRLNACVASSKAYIGASALRGQIDQGPEARPTPQTVAQKPVAPPPARKLPNPMIEEEGSAEVSQEAPASTTAPARRRPRADANTVQPMAQAPEQPAAQPDGATAPNTQETSIPSGKPLPELIPGPPKPETELKPKPLPNVTKPGGNGAAY